MIRKVLTTRDHFLFCLFLEKILEELLFTSVMNFLDENYLLNSNESVLIESPNDWCHSTNDSYESQLLSVVHDIYSLFDCYPLLEVRGMFLDISLSIW